MSVSDPEPHGNTDPSPDSTPDLDGGGGVRPGSTPPESSGTSGLSAPEPRTSFRFPPTGWLTMAAVVVIVLIFVALIIGLLL
ncbi:hypothetical protein HCA61_03935 [Rhodococcus sp. HNM0563]|uniref:DUF6480 family protein n=1 Tax=unclassified Rhodococcus (in: high G+C Gram-positive bacteria) TaxID=192944 RepID=UPI00146AD073|nr:MULTISPECIES: DUF6480 family protein [unclassified Rhodococcus (in: high G+C Gram-positive bacteria)]MCK0090202.1 DUF6480 family protein [Rhodococcus sp. F64268]NLU61410.1 hypothetical protein [Rhodococcus sp. HNM0563]